MATKSVAKTFKSKTNGQRLPPIPIAHEQTTVAATVDSPNSILKKPGPTATTIPDDELLSLLESDNLDSSRIPFQKSQADVLLLLDTYPPKTWTIPRGLRPLDNLRRGDSILEQPRAPKPILDLSSEHQHTDLIDAFPSPLSDRMPSSRHCRRSVSSACSRRSSILFQRATGVQVDPTLLRREDTFDTLCESLSESIRPYALLPPITTDPPPVLSKSLTVPSTEPPASVSPPLVTTEETPIVQQKKEEFTRRLLSKSLSRETSLLTTSKKEEIKPMTTTAAAAAVSKAPVVPAPIKSVAAPRIQKPVIDNRRVQSIERNPAVLPPPPPPPPPPAPIRTKLPATASSTSVAPTHPRTGKFSLDLFLPQSKSNTNQITHKKPAATNCKTKISTGHNKTNASKAKISTSIVDKQDAPTISDVISNALEASQVGSPIKVDDSTTEQPSAPATLEPVSPHIDEPNPNGPIAPRRRSSSRTKDNYSKRCSQPVPQPLTLQGEKTVDADYPPTTMAATVPCAAITPCQRRGSLKSQPLITDLFECLVVETPTSTAVETIRPLKPPTISCKATITLRKQRSGFVKSAKTKKVMPATSKPKAVPTAIVMKTEMKSQSTSTEVDEQQTDDNMIVVGGNNWMMNVKPKVLYSALDEEPMLSQLFDVPTVDDDDLPLCISPTDHLTASQNTLMTSVGDLVRRSSIESVQTIVEISPVLTQIIEHPIETSTQPLLVISKPDDDPRVQSQSNESPLVNSDIRVVYDTVQDSLRKDTSLRSLPTPAVALHPAEPESVLVNNPQTTASSSNGTLPFEASLSLSRTYNNSESSLSARPALRVVTDSLNSRGSETMDSTSSHEDYISAPMFTENDCDEIYRTARKGRPVGRGAYGIVWSYLTMTGRMIAVKEIELDEGDSERVRDDYESVREEVNILRALNHPYIVKFLGISLENTRLVKIFMEYLPNGTIENMLTAFGPFHNDVLRKYTRQIVEGVAYLHDNGVVHRDIKGKNVMLDIDGNIKLIDFGCAKRLKKNQNTHSMRQILKSMKGTANWMAPEVIAETGHGKKADIWSIGCTLCEMATGKPPWSSEHNHLAVLLIIANGTKPPADLPDTCPPAAQQFFRICLTRDPAQRPSARDLLSHHFLAS